MLVADHLRRAAIKAGVMLKPGQGFGISQSAAFAEQSRARYFRYADWSWFSHRLRRSCDIIIEASAHAFVLLTRSALFLHIRKTAHGGDSFRGPKFTEQ